MPITIGYLKDKLGGLQDWKHLDSEKSNFYRLVNLPEFCSKGMINTVDFLVLCMLWCKDDENQTKETMFKRLCKEY